MANECQFSDDNDDDDVVSLFISVLGEWIQSYQTKVGGIAHSLLGVNH